MEILSLALLWVSIGLLSIFLVMEMAVYVDGPESCDMTLSEFMFLILVSVVFAPVTVVIAAAGIVVYCNQIDIQPGNCLWRKKDESANK